MYFISVLASYVYTKFHTLRPFREVVGQRQIRNPSRNSLNALNIDPQNSLDNTKPTKHRTVYGGWTTFCIPLTENLQRGRTTCASPLSLAIESVPAFWKSRARLNRPPSNQVNLDAFRWLTFIESGYPQRSVWMDPSEISVISPK